MKKWLPQGIGTNENVFAAGNENVPIQENARMEMKMKNLSHIKGVWADGKNENEKHRTRPGEIILNLSKGAGEWLKK